VLCPPELTRRLSLIAGRDIDEYRTQAGIERAVLAALRKFGLIPPELNPKKPNPLRLVKSEKSEPPPAA
jgi:hypothetical protein